MLATPLDQGIWIFSIFVAVVLMFFTKASSGAKGLVRVISLASAILALTGVFVTGCDENEFAILATHGDSVIATTVVLITSSGQEYQSDVSGIILVPAKCHGTLIQVQVITGNGRVYLGEFRLDVKLPAPWRLDIDSLGALT